MVVKLNSIPTPSYTSSAPSNAPGTANVNSSSNVTGSPEVDVLNREDFVNSKGELLSWYNAKSTTKEKYLQQARDYINWAKQEAITDFNKKITSNKNLLKGEKSGTSHTLNISGTKVTSYGDYTISRDYKFSVNSNGSVTATGVGKSTETSDLKLDDLAKSFYEMALDTFR